MAQIRTDGSVGAAQTLAGPNFVIPQTLGRLAGSNLFHSFQTFNIPTSGSATFTTSTSAVGNVISRVTGGTLSQINGLLRLLPLAGGAPNFFFINPAGVTFGNGASINVPGAFHVSSANYLKFPDGNFHADLNPVSTFSSMPPEAFGFLGTTRNPVSVDFGARLSQSGTKPLSIVAGDIFVGDVFSFFPVFNTSLVATTSGELRLVAVGSPMMEVPLTGALPEAFGTLSVTNFGEIGSATSSASNAGALRIRAGDVIVGGGLFGGGFIYSDSHGAGNAGTVDIVASGSLSVVNGGLIGSLATGSGNGGNVNVKAGTLTVSGDDGSSNVSTINTETRFTGKAGDISLNVNGAVSILESAFVGSATYASGNAGNVSVKAGSLIAGEDTGLNPFGLTLGSISYPGATGNAGVVSLAIEGAMNLLSGGQVGSVTAGQGNAGSLTITARDLTIDGNGLDVNVKSGLFTVATPGSKGNAGILTVNVSGDMSVLGGAEIRSTTQGAGKAGDLSVHAGNLTVAGPSQISSSASAAAGSTGDAGPLTVVVDGKLTLLSGGQIGSGANNSVGKGGTVTVTATDLVIDAQGNTRGTGLFATTAPVSSGNAGNVIVNVSNEMRVLDLGTVSSSTQGKGNAGSVTVNAGTLTIQDRGKIISAAERGSSGNAGTVSVTVAGTMTVSNSAFVSSSTFAQGDGGNVTVTAGSLVVDAKANAPGATIGASAQPGSSGKAGNVTVNVAGDLLVSNGGTISSSTFGTGSSGNVHVAANRLEIGGQGHPNSSGTGIFANTFSTGNAGNVSVRVNGEMSLSNTGQVASSGFGPGHGGSVTVTAESLKITGQGFFNEDLSTGILATAEAGGNAGNISVNVANEMRIADFGTVSSSTFDAGNGGSIDINAGSLTLLSAGQVLSIATFGSSGKGGNISVTTGSLTVDGQGGQIAPGLFVPAGLFAATQLLSSGDGGNVTVNVKGPLTMRNVGAISSSSGGTGNAGSVFVSANSLDMDNSTIRSRSEFPDSGSAGKVVVNVTGNISLLNTSDISTDTFGRGNAGSVDLSARNLLVDNSFISSDTLSTANAGTVRIAAEGIHLNAGFISSDTLFDSGNAGAVTVTATGPLSLVDGARISSSTSTPGSAGSVQVSAGTILVDGATTNIRALADQGSSGETGNVTVAATQSITLSNGGRISIQNDATVPDPGKIVPTTLTVSAPNITLKDAQITAASTGNVPASDVQINFTNQLFLDPSSITTSANLGDGGSITIQGGKLITLENSQITTSVLGLTGNGGDINISADALFLRTGFIQANTAGPNATGGLVNIDVKTLLATGGSLFLGGDVPFVFQPGVFGFNVIQAAAPTGVSGVIQLTNPILDLSGTLAGLNAQVVDVGGLGRSACQIPGGSSLARAGRGGLPPAASGLLRADAVLVPSEVAERPAPVSLAFRLPSSVPACF